MRREEQEFVGRWSRILAAEGLPPVAGRLWAWLLVCEPAEQTVDEICAAIGASRGAISGAVRWLEPSGLIHRSRRPGDRRDYWSTTPDAMVRVIENRQRQMRPSLQRLREVHSLYQLLYRMVPEAIEQFTAERTARAAAGVPQAKD